jgi:hypothetical protein
VPISVEELVASPAKKVDHSTMVSLRLRLVKKEKADCSGHK